MLLLFAKGRRSLERASGNPGASGVRHYLGSKSSSRACDVLAAAAARQHLASIYRSGLTRHRCDLSLRGEVAELRQKTRQPHLVSQHHAVAAR